MMEKLKIKFIPVFICIMVFLNAGLVQAAEESDNANQIVFVLDGSKSMVGDKWQEALDCVLMVEAMLPSGYQAALAVYNTDVDTVVGFGQSMEDGILGLRDRKQKGYTDPGAALEAALEMFGGDLSGGKYVVFITDGEVSLPGAEETEAAFASYQVAAAKAAEQGIIVDVLLYETADIEDRVSDGAALTGGSCFHRTQERTAEDFGENYLFERLGLERIMLRVSDSPDNLTEVSLQDTFAERVRILLTSKNGLQDIQVSCQSRKISTVQGDRFAVITLEHPLEDTVDLQYVLAEKGRMTAYLVKEYDLSVSAEAFYIPETGCHQIRIRVVNSEGKDILEDPEIRDAVAIYIDGAKTPYEVLQGRAVINRFEESTGEIDLEVNFGGLNSRVYCDNAQISLWLEAPPEESAEEEMPYFWLCVVIAGVCVTFVVLSYLLLRSRKKKTKLPEMRKQGRPILMKY